MQNSLVAQNTAQDGSQDCQGQLSSLGYNLLGDTHGCTFSGQEGNLLDMVALVYPAVPLKDYPDFGTPPPYAPVAHGTRRWTLATRMGVGMIAGRN